MSRKKEPVHYVDNEKFFEAMVAYKKQLKETDGDVRIPEYIGDCIQKIANNIINKHNFSKYPFRDEMIFDGIENALRYLNNFDPEITQNPFAYFSQIIFWAFVRRINKEHEQLYTIFKKTIEMESLLLTADKQDIDDLKGMSDLNINDYTREYMYEFIENFERKKEEKKRKLKVKK